MNFSGLSNTSILGQALRLALSCIPDGSIVPILQTRMRGMKWILGSSTNGCWLGSYEYRKRKLFEANVSHGQVLYDLGANVGFYTLLAATLVGPKGFVYAFEPLPRNAEYLRRHIEMNRVGNAAAFEIAISSRCGTAAFECTGDPSMAGLASSGSLVVRCSTLDAAIRDRGLRPPDILKIDVEGAESDVLTGAAETLERHRPRIFLSTHGQAQEGACCAQLRDQFNYDVEPIQEAEFLALPRM